MTQKPCTGAVMLKRFANVCIPNTQTLAQDPFQHCAVTTGRKMYCDTGDAGLLIWPHLNHS